MSAVLFNLLEAAPKAYPNTLTVVLLGLGTVFVGLVSIILLCTLLGLIVRGTQKPAEAPAPSPAPAAPVSEAIPNRGEFIAAVSAAVAEELGTDVSGIRILSVKRL